MKEMRETMEPVWSTISAGPEAKKVILAKMPKACREENRYEYC
jgi:hypothetical protein